MSGSSPAWSGAEAQITAAAVPRRRALRRGLVAAASATALPAVLAGCASGAAGGSSGVSATTPAPQTAQPVTTITIQPWRYDGSKVLQTVMGGNLAGFEAKHPGVRVRMTVGEKPPVAALLVNDAPDVIQANDQMPYAPGGLILPLDTYIKRDNLDLSVWPALQINDSRFNGTIHGLPSYFNMVVMMANLGALDEAGVSYPSPDWTHDDLAKLAASLTQTKAGKKRYGAALLWIQDGPGDMEYLLEGFGSGLMDASDTLCRLSEPAAIAAGQWVYEQMLWAGMATEDDVLGAVLKGAAAIGPTRPDQLVFGENVVTRAAGLKWDFLPMPHFPKGRGTNAPAQYYMINAGSKSPDLAWDLVRWITYEPSWQQMMMRLALIPPSLTALSAEWETVVRSIVPPLQSKALNWFGDAMQNNYAYPYRYYTYSDDQAKQILSGYTSALAARKIDVPLAFRQAADQVDAVEKAGAAMVPVQAAAAKAFPAAGPAVVSVPAGV